MNRAGQCACCSILAISVTLFVSPGIAQQVGRTQDPLARVKDVAEQLSDEIYELRYRFQKGDVIRYQVVHLVTVKTKVDGNSQTNQSRSTSTKKWTVTDVKADGNIVLEHRVEHVDMWSETQGRKAVHYDSRTDASPPPEYEHVARQVGKPLATITIDACGRILDRDDGRQQIDMGTGGLTVPLPDRRVAVGTEWSVPSTVPVRQTDGSVRAIKTRQRYRLEKVVAGVATIAITTQVLTPSIDARQRSQLIQKLAHGTIRFDLDTGRVIAKELDWDETVVGFDGPETNMAYLGRLTETLVTEPKVAARPE